MLELIMLQETRFKGLLNKIYLKCAIYLCVVFFQGCTDNNMLDELRNLKIKEQQLNTKVKTYESELGQIKINLARLETELKQANTTINTNKENLRLQYESEFSRDLQNKFDQEKKSLIAELEKSKHDIETNFIKNLIIILIFLLIICFIFYMWVKNQYAHKEANLNAEKVAIEDEKTVMFNEICTRTIYGQKLQETINKLEMINDKLTKENIK